MNRLSKGINLVLITAGLAIPVGIRAYAAAIPQNEHDTKERAEKQEKVDKAEKKLRVFDAKHNDYHDWDANEDKAYHTYLTERHEEYTPYGKLTTEKQTEYWNWRHEHPDHDDVNHDRDEDKH
jgi:hypothetical protein